MYARLGPYPLKSTTPSNQREQRIVLPRPTFSPGFMLECRAGGRTKCPPCMPTGREPLDGLASALASAAISAEPPPSIAQLNFPSGSLRARCR